MKADNEITLQQQYSDKLCAKNRVCYRRIQKKPFLLLNYLLLSREDDINIIPTQRLASMEKRRENRKGLENGEIENWGSAGDDVFPSPFPASPVRFKFSLPRLHSLLSSQSPSTLWKSCHLGCIVQTMFIEKVRVVVLHLNCCVTRTSLPLRW